MGARCLDLSDERARDAAVAGAKAAGLAAASAAGLPALPGIVVPVDESAPVVRAALPALAGDDVTRARLAAMTVHPDDGLLAELHDRAARHPSPLIVRSSSPLEADGTWSGAFSSFHGVGRSDLGTAVRGCWGSAFGVGVLDRARRSGVDPARLGLAVLVQPEVAPGLGGTARYRSDGSVRIDATRGPLSPLMAGHVQGTVTIVDPDDTAATVGDDVLFEVATLTRRVHDLLGHQLIEWAVAEGRAHLLQSMCSPEPATAGSSVRSEPALRSAVARRVATLTQRFPGSLGYDLVLPWAVAAESVPEPVAVPAGADPVELLAATRRLVDELNAAVWRRAPQAAVVESERTLRQLRGDAADAAIGVFESLPRPDLRVAGRVTGNLDALRRVLRANAVVDSDAAFWRLTPEGLGMALRTGTAPVVSRLGVDTWEPFVHRVVMAAGAGMEGTPAAPGAGVGRAHSVTDATSRSVIEGRCVLIADQPTPALAPLLWNAAGLVTRAGSPAAHLMEFARSIGVPAVTGCDIPRASALPDGPVVAVDGTGGHVALAGLP